MTNAKPPDRGKYSDLLKKEWRLEIPAANYRWFRTPGKMEARHFELGSFKSLVGFTPFYYRKEVNGEEKHFHAVRASFDPLEEGYDEEFAKAEILVAKSGRVFQAIEKADIFKPEKRLYISGLPDEASVADIKDMFKDYATFYEHTRKVFCVEQKRFTGKMMIRVKNFLKVPPRHVHLKCDNEDYNGLGITISATGYNSETPVEETKRKCFKCKTYGHVAKDCKVKLSFSWKCDKCSVSSLNCYEGNCAFDQMVKDVKNLADEVLDIATGPPAALDQLKLTMVSKVHEFRDQLNKFFVAFKKSSDQKAINTKGKAIKRYLDRSIANFSKYVPSLDNYVTQFEDYLINLLQKVCSKGTEKISMHE